jgi:prenyltransferase beta subunit
MKEKKMQNFKKFIIGCSILLIISSTIIIQVGNSNSFENNQDIHQRQQDTVDLTERLSVSSSKSNYDIIDEIFGKKLLEYSTQGYFSQIYEASLQATYYALFILEAVGYLNVINQTEILNYIMSHYDENSYIFMDDYSDRYLETDFSTAFYPLTSVLETNCYAILSLNILNSLDMIDVQESINFIWSCYNPITSGFIGQSYDSLLYSRRKVSTMDNTYFAVKTLDFLMGSWVAYNQEKNEIIQYVNSLQIMNNIDWEFGGFYNDNDTNFYSLRSPLFEPNLLSAYYCIKSLEIFGMENTINYNNFYQFLDTLYDPSSYLFRMSLHYSNNDFTNLVATAIGMELSQITGFSSVNQNEVINFILNNRNSLGNWDQSTTVDYHELIDTFQIVRCLKESGEINQLSSQEKNQIASSIDLYQQYNGYSLLSKDYMSMDLINNIINTFDLFNRISDVDVLGLYSLIESSYKEFDDFNLYGFIGSTKMDESYISFRSCPIEYYGTKDYLYSHKFTYLGLNSLKGLFKLDDFALNYNLMNLLNSIVNSQFLDNNYDNYGAFLPMQIMLSKP